MPRFSLFDSDELTLRVTLVNLIAQSALECPSFSSTPEEILSSQSRCFVAVFVSMEVPN